MHGARKPFGLLVASSFGALATAAQEPLPVERSVTLKTQGLEFSVEGRVLIERRIDIASQRAITIRGLGEGATLVVEGSFEAKAVLGGANVFENLTIELAPECRGLYLANVEWKGGGGIRTAEGAPTSAKVYCEYVNMEGGVEVETLAGSIDLQASSFVGPVSIRGHAFSEKKSNATKVKLLTCKKGGLAGGLTLSGVADATVRNNFLGGPLLRLERVAVLDLDGNMVHAPLTELIAAHYTGFQRTKVRNCDFGGASVRVYAPAEGDKRLKLSFQHCWFRGLTDEAAILREIVKDARKDETCGVLAAFAKIAPRPLGLGGTVLGPEAE